MQNSSLDESQDGVKTAGTNFSNLSYADDATLMAESEEELKIKDAYSLEEKLWPT